MANENQFEGDIQARLPTVWTRTPCGYASTEETVPAPAGGSIYKFRTLPCYYFGRGPGGSAQEKRPGSSSMKLGFSPATGSLVAMLRMVWLAKAYG